MQAGRLRQSHGLACCKSKRFLHLSSPLPAPTPQEEMLPRTPVAPGPSCAGCVEGSGGLAGLWVSSVLVLPPGGRSRSPSGLSHLLASTNTSWRPLGGGNRPWCWAWTTPSSSGCFPFQKDLSLPACLPRFSSLMEWPCLIPLLTLSGQSCPPDNAVTNTMHEKKWHFPQTKHLKEQQQTT